MGVIFNVTTFAGGNRSEEASVIWADRFFFAGACVAFSAL